MNGFGLRAVGMRMHTNNYPSPAHVHAHTCLFANVRYKHMDMSDLEKCLVTLFPAGQLPDDATLAKRVFIYLHGQNSKDSQQ